MRRSVSVGLSAVACVAVLPGMAPAQELDEAGYVYRTEDGTRTQRSPRAMSHSVARQWNDVLLESIRNDRARPTVHARNLYHTSAAMWDAWAAYDDTADQVFHEERQTAKDVEAAREEAISFAAYRILIHRFEDSVGAEKVLPIINNKMDDLGYDSSNDTMTGDTPAALGNRIADTIITFGASDGANEDDNYANEHYEPVNEPLVPDFPGNPEITHPNRWQPLSLKYFVDQSGNPIPVDVREFLSAEWGAVPGFALDESTVVEHPRDGFDYPVYHDPGPPPQINGEGDEYYRWGNEMVLTWSEHLDPSDGVMIDISPNNFGNTPLPAPENWESYYNFFEGGDSGTGWDTNPVTGKPYPEQVVPRGDYTRILAEFWADGPDSETPPGHWFTILNYVNDHPKFEKRLAGDGPVLDNLEWDVKAYLLMGGAMHDSAVTAWGCKGAYDYIRPISAVRYMGDQGQSSDPNLPNYDPDGIRLYPGFIELVTEDSTQPGERHEHLDGEEGKIAVKAWRGPDYIDEPETDVAGVGWILLENWWPYQRPTFVTPPFAGYVSGHSTFSRAASEVMTYMTGSAFFPGGKGEFFCPQNEFLVFEDGPSQDITLQWATYRDASDQTSLSRIWGGIHPPADDLPGRIMGLEVAQDAFRRGVQYFNGNADCIVDFNGDGAVTSTDFIEFINAFAAGDTLADINADHTVTSADFLEFIDAYAAGCP